MARIIVVRFEPYPPDEPTGWVVGFNVTCNNSRTFYMDTLVSYQETTTDEEAINKAYEKLKESIDTRIAELEKKSPLIGKEIIITEEKTKEESNG